MTSLEHALDLYSLGLCVIPVPYPRPGGKAGAPGDGKVPALAWREFQGRRPTESEIRSWFRTPQNIAIVTGRISGVVAVDADSSEAVRWVTKHLHYTPWQTKSARGFHLLYRHPVVRVPNRAHLDTHDGRLALDVRGDGGYVIGPGSLHASGTRYEFAGDWSIPRDRLPIFWVGWLRRPERLAPPRPIGRRPTGDVVERARRYLSAIPQPEIGNGSDADTLYAACRVVRGFGVDEHTATELLWEWAGGRPGWSHEWIARKVHNAHEYGREPVGALR